MDRVRATLAVFLILLAISVAKPYISATPNKINILEGEYFKINVSFSTNISNKVLLETEFNNSLLSLIYPNETIDFGKGGFSGVLEYKFFALTGGKGDIIFKIGNTSSTVSVNVKPKYVKLNVNKSMFAEKGSNFTINASVDAMNVNDVKIIIHANRSEFSTPSSEISIGSGSFSKNVKIPFESINPKRKISNITLEVCSSIGCKNTTIEVYNKIFEVNITPLEENVSLGGEVSFKLDTLIYNYDAPSIDVNFDDNWFEETNNIQINEGHSTDIIKIKMRNDGIGCPIPIFEFIITTDGKKVEKQFTLKITPKEILKIAPDKSAYEEGETIDAKITAKAFGMKNIRFALAFSNENFELASADFDYEKAYLQSKGENSITFKRQYIIGKPKYVVILSKPNETCLNYEGNIKLIVKKQGNLKEEIILAELNGTKVINSTSKSIFITQHTASSSMSVCPPTIFSAKSINSRGPCLPRVCPPGFSYDPIHRKCISNKVEIVCPENSTYNKTTKRCEIHPEVEVICEKGEYNPDTDKCEYTPEIKIICENGEYIPPSNQNESGVCVWHPEEVPICNRGQYNPNTTKCEYVPDEKVICEKGEYNPDTDKCEYTPETTATCTVGTYNAQADKCEITPTVEYVCEEGNYNATTGVCEVYPNSSYICTEGGYYNTTLQKCVINVTEIVCENKNATYINGTCVYTPNTTTACEKGTFNPEMGLCVFSPNTTVVCEKGEYDPERDICVYKPNVTIFDTIELSSKVGETISISTEINNPTGSTISGISTSLTPTNYTLINYTLNATELAPNQTAVATYLIKFNEPGEYNLTLKVEDESGNYNLRKYHFTILPDDSLITGLSIFSGSKPALLLLTLFVIVITYLFLIRRI
ncbi:MAG: hypothetical protein J7K73_00845 [Nanoarchaeota archaeon]|nr:hypothetical protein [Nanoarchaeota archaeon]